MAIDCPNCASPNAPKGEETSNVSTGEVCTIIAAKQYGIFGTTQVIDPDKAYANDMDILANNDQDPSSKYSLCKLSNNGKNAIQNCVLTTKNPWKTLNDTEQYCTLPYNITPPDGLNYVGKSTITMEKPANIPKWKPKEKCFQEKWYDWFSIPDYHLGNSYSVSSNLYLKPCSIGLVPSLGTPDKCTTKEDFKDGKYAGTFSYMPLALIHLLGNTKTTLIEKYKAKMYNNMADLIKNNIGTMNQDIYDHITGNQASLDELYNDIRSDLRPMIDDLLRQPFDDRNIIEPYFGEEDIIKPITTKDRIEDAYNIAKQLHTLDTSNLTYNTSETLAAYNDWKKQLADVTGYTILDSRFQKQIMTLKKACDISFSNKNEYSKRLINILNSDAPKDKGKLPLEFFPISQEDRIKSMSSTVSENPVEADIGQRNLLLQQEEAANAILDKDDMELNKIEYDPIKYGDNVHDEVLNNPLAENVTTAKTVIMAGIAIIMFILFFGILYIIGSLLWEPLAVLMNSVILGFYIGILKLKDALFKGSDPPSYDKEILALQKSFLEKKIINDIKKYKLDM